MEIFKVIESGLLTTVQDEGRARFRLDGISEGGAFDKFALAMANKCVGNEFNTPSLEITLVGPKLVLLNDAVIALTGANLGARVNNKFIGMYKPITVKKGDIISFGRRKWGCRTYLAVTGGILCEKVFGSFSTDSRIGLGGMKLLAGQIIEGGNFISSETKTFEYSKRVVKSIYNNLEEIEVIEGPDLEFFDEESYRIFYSSIYEVTMYLDRSGIRLIGQPIKRKNEEMLSRPTTIGNIQIMPDGQPIVLGADCQTIGGYPRIATVISADICKLAQLVPGDKIKFKPTNISAAVTKLKTIKNLLSLINIAYVEGGNIL
ncbi:MAG: biotin-dependent carboxyltransferase family protein [Planctomycetota bacterium]